MSFAKGTDFMIKPSRDVLMNLVDGTINALIDDFLEDERNDDSLPYLKKIVTDIKLFVKVALKIVGSDPKDAYNSVEELGKKISYTKKQESQTLKYFRLYLYNILKWAHKYYPDYTLNIVNNLEKYETAFLSGYRSYDATTESKTDVLSQESDVISAEEFMNNSYIDEDDIADLKHAIDIYLSNTDKLVLDQYYIDLSKEILSIFIRILDKETSFSSLVDSILLLQKKLNEIDASNLSDDQKELYVNMLDAIFQDIGRWVYEVLVHRTAKDIHYLDDALKANITQIDIVINQQNANETEEDGMEFF